MNSRACVTVAALLVLFAAACTPETGSTVAGTEAVAHPPLAVSGHAVATLLNSVESARMRVLPALGETTAGTRMARSLWRVETALRDNDGAMLAFALQRARIALKEERAKLADSGLAAELDALMVTFAAMEAAVPTSLRGTLAAE